MFSVLPLSSCLLCSPRAHVILHPQCSNIGLDGTPMFQNGLALRGSKVLVHLFYSLLALMQHVNEVDQSIHTTITFYLGMLSPHGSFFNLCWRSPITECASMLTVIGLCVYGHFCKSREHEGQEFQGQLGLQYMITNIVKQCHISC